MLCKMGLTATTVEEDAALRLCRERKNFVRQAMDGRCSLASAHTSYLASLRNTGSALRVFFEAEVPIGCPLDASPGGMVESIALTKGSASLRLSTFSPSPDASTPILENPIKSREVQPASSVATDPVTKSGTSLAEGGDVSLEDPPWDYFGLHPRIDSQFSLRHGQDAVNAFGRAADPGKSKETEKDSFDMNDDGGGGGGEEEEYSLPSAEGSGDTVDEFNSPASHGLTGRSDNVNRANGEFEVSPSLSLTSTTETETEFYNGNKFKSPFLTPMRDTASATNVEQTTNREDSHENKNAPCDFISNIKEINKFFLKASESGQEVLILLGADKFHFREALTEQEKKRERSPFSCLTACFTCEEEHDEPVREENQETAVKYLTWHSMASYHTSPYGDRLAWNMKSTVDDLGSYRFENFCTIHGNHASTLDRLYAWERKLYNEVKASGIIRRKYDMMCKVLRDEEMREAHSGKVYKTRAVIKDLHSSIRVAIQRIDSVSKMIEELRDRELEPQLEELIEALRRMWEVMFECHDRQVRIISAAYSNNYPKVPVGSDLRRQITLHLENELNSLSSSFTTWIASQRFYIRSINDWLLKCVLIPHKTPKRKRKSHTPSIKDLGPPPIYVTCADWLGILESFPPKEVKESIKALAAETIGFLPRPDKSRGQTRSWRHSILSNIAKGGNPDSDSVKHEAPPEEASSRSNRFRSVLTNVLESLNEYSHDSLKKYTELQKVLLKAKTEYENYKR